MLAAAITAAHYQAAADCALLSIAGMMKASPVEEAGRRYLYIEASNETRDLQGEVVLTKALADSADYYLRYGNVDLDHITVTGPRRGPPNYALYEIGRPVEVRAGRGKTFVKAELYQGDAPVAANANAVWDSLTRIRPPQRWYPSVGGAVLDKQTEIGPNGDRRVVVTKVRWTNIGLSKTPVNANVPTVSTVPIGALAKAWSAHGLDLTKALAMANGGTDAASLTGGPALQRQSLDREVQSYFAFREQAAKAIREGRVAQNPRALMKHAEAAMRLDPDTASAWTERFFADLAHQLRQRTARKTTTPTTSKESRHAG